MSKGDTTRQHIIEQAAILFNQQGFAGTAMSDIMSATGLGKGGIYNHFGSKGDIALEAFDLAFERLNTYFTRQLEGVESPLERLMVFIESFGVYRDDPIIAGGCPIMNTAIDVDDFPDTDDSYYPALRARALEAFTIWERIIQRRLRKAIAAGEARPDTDIATFSSLTISSLEGAVMLSRIHNDFSHLDRVIAHLLDVIERDIRVQTF